MRQRKQAEHLNNTLAELEAPEINDLLLITQSITNVAAAEARQLEEPRAEEERKDRAAQAEQERLLASLKGAAMFFKIQKSHRT